MRARSLLWLALLPHAAPAFLAAPRRAALSTRLRANLNDGPVECDADKLAVPKPAKRRLLSRLGAASSALLLSAARPPAARAATPLLVTRDGVAPLIAPGLGVVRVPGAVPPIGAGAALPAAAGGVALFVALSVALTAALARAADGGHVKLARLLGSFAGSVAPASFSAVRTRMLPFVGSVVAGEAEEKEEAGPSSPREVDWGTYARAEVDPLTRKGAEGTAGPEYNPHTMLFERVEAAEEPRDTEEAKLQQASKFYREQQYKQHHHPIRVSRSAYIDGLYVNEMETRDLPLGYLGALGDAKASTWDAYKHQLDGARPADEVLDREQSTNEELRELERKSREYREAVNEAVERDETAFEAMIKDAMRMMRREESKGANLSS